MSLETITLWGTGKESRDFIYIDDIIQIIDLAIKHSTFNGEVVNVANGRQETISNIVNIFLLLLNNDKPVTFNGIERKGDPINWEADISTILKWGYKSKVDINEGIKRYILWIQENV